MSTAESRSLLRALDSASPSSQATRREGRALAGILVVIALVCFPTLRFGFVYDDQWVLVANGFLRRPEDLWLLLTPEARARGVPDAFRPTSVLLDVVSYSLIGLRPWAHHALSIALHLLSCFALYRLLRQLQAPAETSLAAGLLFGLLALHAEVVAVVSFREDLLATSLGLLACTAALQAIGSSAEEGAISRAPSPLPDHELALIGARSSAGDPMASRWSRTGFALLAALLATLACTSKESAWPLPLAMAIALLWNPWRRVSPWLAIRSTTPLVVGVAMALLHRGTTTGAIAPWASLGVDAEPGGSSSAIVDAVEQATVASPGGFFGEWASLAQGLTALAWSSAQVLVPLGLSPEYPERPDLVHLATLALTICALALTALLVLRARKAQPAKLDPTGRIVLTVLCTVLVTATMMVPLSGLIALPNAQADRHAYFWSVPLSVALAGALLELGTRLAAFVDGNGANQAPREATSISVPSRWLPLLLAACLQGSAFVGAVHSYSSDTSIWERAFKVAPKSPRVLAMLGLQDLAARRGRLRDEPRLRVPIEARCRAALEADPRHELAHICLAQLAFALEDFEAAQTESFTALQLARARADRLLGDWLEASSRFPPGIAGPDRMRLLREIDRGRSRFPYSADLAASSARVAHRLGEPKLALEHIRTARSLRPERWQTVAWGLEIALDTGDAPNVAHTFWVDKRLLDAADPATRDLLAHRFQHLMRSHPTPLIDAFFAPGVFPNESP